MKEEGGSTKGEAGRRRNNEEGSEKRFILCPTLSPNAFSEDLSVSRSHFEHPRL